jgi:hypothetical protein
LGYFKKENSFQKVESPMKKKKNEDLSKLVTRNDPIETILAQFNVELRPFLDGDYQVSFTFKSLLQQQIDSNYEQIKTTKKKDSPNDKKRSASSKEKQKGFLFLFFSFYSNFNLDKKLLNENPSEPLPLPDPFQCSIQFQLQRYVSQSQII